MPACTVGLQISSMHIACILQCAVGVLFVVLFLLPSTLPRCCNTGRTPGCTCGGLVAAQMSGQQCIQDAAVIMDRSCDAKTAPSNASRQSCYATIMSEKLLDCLDHYLQAPSDKAIRIMIPHIFEDALLKKWADGFYVTHHANVSFTRVPTFTLNDEVIYDIKANVSILAHAGWFLGASAMAEAFEANGMTDLAPFMQGDTGKDVDELEWFGILPYFRDVASQFANNLFSIPVDGEAMLLFYRRDLFLQYNLTVPATWEDTVQIARRMNGTDMNGDGNPVYGFCLETLGYCKVSYYVVSIMASYIQTNGTSQGLYFNPETMEPLTNNPGMQRALEIYKQLASFSPPGYNNCSFSHPFFDNGTCLMTLNMVAQFQRAAMGSESVIQDKFGVARLPGTLEVLNRTSNELQPCNPTLCGYADVMHTQKGAKLVNRAPFTGFGGWMGAVNSVVNPTQQYLAYRFFSYLTSLEVSFSTILDPLPTNMFGPFREAHLKDIDRWLAMGYPQQATVEFLEVLTDAFAHENIAMDIRLPSINNLRFAMYNAVGKYVTNQVSVEATMMSIQSGMQQVASGGDAAHTAQLYRWSINFKERNSTTREIRSEDSFPVMIAVLLVVAVVLMLALLLGWLWWRLSMNPHLTLLGKVIPPGLNSDTTIVVTDIQDSTALWELLPQEVMEAAMKLHNDVVLRLLLRHSGYESATEGDSFILAFHSAQDALRFAVDLQQQLLMAPWPQELLEVPGCRPFFVTSTRGAKDTITTNWGPQCELVPEKSLEIPLPDPSELRGLAPSDVREGEAGEFEREASCVNFKQLVKQSFPAATGDRGTSLLVFRGLRVRIGMHSGVADANNITANAAINRIQYTGDILAAAKTVCSGAQGGMILLNESTYKRLRMEEVGQCVLVLQCGSHIIRNTKCHLYQAVGRDVMPRLGWLDPIRSHRQLGLGALEAPTGLVTAVFFLIQGTKELLSWDASATRRALHLLHELANPLLAEAGGYLVEETDDLILASFPSADAAACWSMMVIRDALELDWPEELLAHPLGEALAFQESPHHHPKLNSSPPSTTFILRGLRLKAGIDIGSLMGSPHGTTGRISYRGKAMNRAARIATSATSGQVLCSLAAWQQALARAPGKLEAISSREVKLRGIAAPMRLYHCSLRRCPRKCANKATPPDVLKSSDQVAT